MTGRKARSPVLFVVLPSPSKVLTQHSLGFFLAICHNWRIRKPDKRKIVAQGRPTKFTEELASQICELLSEGNSLRKICKRDDMPATSTVCKWLSENISFSEQYARAREIQADALFDEILDIADDGLNDKYVDENGIERTDQDVIARSRLRVDARKWMAGKLRPKKYGDKIELSGDNESPVQHVIKWQSEK